MTGVIPVLKWGEENTSSGSGVGEAVGVRVKVGGMDVGVWVDVGSAVWVADLVGVKADISSEVRDSEIIGSSLLEWFEGFSSWDETQADKPNNKTIITIIFLIRIKLLTGDESMP
ncbi:MAG TPA: hypothetical protein VIM80_02185 [Brevefilum sp.]